MTKTIKEIADELGYSKTYISKIIKSNGLQSSLRKNGNKFVVSDEVEILIKEHLGVVSKTKFENNSQTENKNENKKMETVFDNDNNSYMSREETKRNLENEQKQVDDFSKEMFDFLREQIQQKDLQISQKDEQLVEVNERLKETIIMLNDTRKELSNRYSLIETDNGNNDLSEDNNEENTKKNRWWKFWK